MNKTILTRALVPCLLAASAASQAQLFDFEGEAATGYTGAHTSLAITSGAQTMTITRGGGKRFDIVSNTLSDAGKPAGWGLRSLQNFFDPSAGPYILDFAVGINFFSVEVGDYEPSDDDVVVIEAWTGAGGTGTLLGSTGGLLPSDTSGFDWDSFGFGGSPAAMSIVMYGGSTAFPQSLYWDNIRVSSVPEPATLAVLGLGVAALRRRRK